MTDTHPTANDRWDWAQPNARRSLWLCGAGAILGLVIAGVGLFTAQGTRTATVPAEDAAIVNNVPILMADMIGQLRALYDVGLTQATPEQKRKVLDDMIREELFVQRGIEMGLPNDDIDVRQALINATEAQVAQDAMTARPAEEELRTFYAANPDRYASEGTMILHEYLLRGDIATAARTVAALRARTAATALGLKTAGRVDDGEEFYFAARIHLGDHLFAAARGLKDGEISDPIEQPDGFHILQMVANNRPRAMGYDQVRDRVLRDFLLAKVARLQAGNERFLRKRADVKIAAALL
ncbi:MAG TPA: peptidylprolyl isomerase [Sphingomonas sp.]|uniref:peptidylprolyl isomerase n=1 Tax=Sphingomonas sp. TaxID=28214 RepID=UPI002BA826A4|nr:peptidylprolyl isomerase [Sphingomonas sp.]HMI19157.1 peptidylprolyl isomerase [Sphingomonas sp.]